MTKREFIEKALEVARNTHERNLTLTDMDAALGSLCEVAAAELLGGGEIPLPGVGKLKVQETAARKGRNPRTGAPIDIPAGKKVYFVPGSDLKDALKG